MNKTLQALIDLALKEDIGSGDATSISLIEEDVIGEAILVARHPYILSGVAVAEAVFTSVDANLKTEILEKDGTLLEPHKAFMRITGPTRSLLTAERTALNFIQRMCGIATLSHEFTELVKHTDAVILDTRKTLPGYRELDKYAVKCGGATNHRMGLYDRVMIKDNHVQHWTSTEGFKLPEAVRIARKAYPKLVIEAEADTVEQVHQLVEAGPEWILLDNMTLEQLRECVGICKGKCKTEASGGVNLDTVKAIAETGVDAISVGALTHSVKAADISLDLLK